jgi:predicted deacylase
MHGDEFDAVLVVQRLITSLDLQRLRGTVIALPCVNVSAFHAMARTSPIDGQDLNRLFPGDVTGTSSQKLAHELWSAIRTSADYVVDVHSSTEPLVGMAHAIYFDDGRQASKIASEMTRRSGLPLVWRSTGTWLANALYCRATQEGIPCALLDVGDLDHRAGDIEDRTSGLESVMTYLEMLPGSSEDPRNYWVVSDPDWLRSEHAGVLCGVPRIGTRLPPGAEVFQVLDATGQKLQTAVSPEQDSLVITVRRSRAAQPRLEVASLGTVVQSPSGNQV